MIWLDSAQRWAEQPPGMRDMFTKQAKTRREIENILLQACEQHGFEMVSSGAFEYVDTLLRGRANREAEEWIRLFDTAGRTVALRPEVTPSIARMAAPLIQAGHQDIRWCYAERVFHRTDDPASLSWTAGRAAESTQVGIEWIGQSSHEADVQVLQICWEGLKSLSIRDVQIVLSHAEFTPAYLLASGLSADAVEQAMATLVRGDYVGFRQLLSASRRRTEGAGDKGALDKYDTEGAYGTEGSDGWAALQQLSSLNPLDPDSLPERVKTAWQGTEDGKRALGIWEDLVQFGRELQGATVRENVVFDLTLARDLTYYTGIVFEVFTSGVGAPVALGGRYDRLLAQFGAESPAIGFAYEVERLLTAYEEAKRSC